MTKRRQHPTVTAKASQSVALAGDDPRSRRNAQALTADVDQARERRGADRASLSGLNPLPLSANLGQAIARLNEMLLALKGGA